MLRVGRDLPSVLISALPMLVEGRSTGASLTVLRVNSVFACWLSAYHHVVEAIAAGTLQRTS